MEKEMEDDLDLGEDDCFQLGISLQSIIKASFTLEDLLRSMQEDDISTALSIIKLKTFPVALQGMDDAIVQKVASQLTERARYFLRDDMQLCKDSDPVDICDRRR
jgi:flagellar motor switch protein FliG